MSISCNNTPYTSSTSKECRLPSLIPDCTIFPEFVIPSHPIPSFNGPSHTPQFLSDLRSHSLSLYPSETIELTYIPTHSTSRQSNQWRIPVLVVQLARALQPHPQQRNSHSLRNNNNNKGRSLFHACGQVQPETTAAAVQRVVAVGIGTEFHTHVSLAGREKQRFVPRNLILSHPHNVRSLFFILK